MVMILEEKRIETMSGVCVCGTRNMSASQHDTAICDDLCFSDLPVFRTSHLSPQRKDSGQNARDSRDMTKRTRLE